MGTRGFPAWGGAGGGVGLGGSRAAPMVMVSSSALPLRLL